MLALSLLALLPTGSWTIVDFNTTKASALIHIVGTEPDPDRDGADPCKLEELGGKSESYVVVDRDGSGTYDIASFATKPCATKASAAKARAETEKALAAMGFHPDRKDLKVTRIPDKKGPIHRERSVSEKEDPIEVLDYRIVVDDIVIRKTEDEFSQMAGGNLDIIPLLIEENGKKFLFETVEHTDMRSSDGKYRVIGPLALPANGLDVAGLRAMKLDAQCRPLIASNRALVENVAATLAWILSAPMTPSQKERATSVVYANDACTESAKKLAAKIPGGATVEKLSWKAATGTVVALGASAAPK